MRKTTLLKKQKLVDALVEKYGNRCIISRKQLLDIHSKSPLSYPHPVIIEKDEDHKFKHGYYFICKDLTRTKQEKEKYIQEQNKKNIPKKIKHDPVALYFELFCKQNQ